MKSRNSNSPFFSRDLANLYFSQAGLEPLGPGNASREPLGPSEVADAEEGDEIVVGGEVEEEEVDEDDDDNNGEEWSGCE